MSKSLSENFYFKTSELSLAATLVYFGFPLDHLEAIGSQQRLSFVFPRKEGIDNIIQDFWSDNASISPKRYFYILKELKSRIYAERGEYATD